MGWIPGDSKPAGGLRGDPLGTDVAGVVACGGPMKTAIVFLFLALSAMQASGDGDLTLADVVSAHEAALGSIHKIELTMRHDNRYFASGKPLSEPDSWTWHWAKDGSTQRMRFRTEPAVRSDGLPDGIYDLLADDREVRMLQNWDPDAPQKITPLNQGSLSAQISQRDRGSPFVANPEKHLLWRFDFDVVGESWSLGDLVRESGVAELAGKADIDGHPTWHIRVLDPKSGGTVMPGFGFDIFVDPAVNFFVRRVIEHHRDIKQEINGVEETYPIDVTRTVTTFHDAGGGVFVPTSMKFRAVSGSSDRREMACETSVTDLKVNEDLSPGALDFRFPEDALVIYSPPLSPTRQRVVLWGPDNLPRKEITNRHDIPGFEAALRQSDLDATRRPVGRDAK